MIFRLAVENFYSISDRQELDLRVAENAPDERGRLVRPWPNAPFRYPAVVALFGANASGKTNVLRAISFLRWWNVDSFHARPGSSFPLLPFQFLPKQVEPTRFEVDFAGPLDLNVAADELQLCTYTYELEIDISQNRVNRESLRYRPESTGYPRRIFERISDDTVKGSDMFSLEGFSQALEKILRPEVGLVSTLAQLQHPQARRLWDITQWIYSNVFIDTVDGTPESAIPFYHQNPDYLAALNQEIRRFDLGISGVHMTEAQGQPTVVFEHDGLDKAMLLRFESTGTRRFFYLFPALHQTLQTGGIAVIDELDRDIHPMALPEIIGWFHNPERNPHGAQLWFTCHNPSILEELIKEEIVFTEKDEGGRTSVFALTDIKGVRRVDNFYKQYLGGVYGAVPTIG